MSPSPLHTFLPALPGCWGWPRGGGRVTVLEEPLWGTEEEPVGLGR